MARIRTIKPEFWEDEKIAELSIPCRLFFIGCWNYADDFGVIKGNAFLLKSQIFPYDETLRVSELKKWIDALVNARFLIPISHQGESYYLIRTFRIHQILDKRYDKSFIGKNIIKDLINNALRNTMSDDENEHYVNTTSLLCDDDVGKGKGKGNGNGIGNSVLGGLGGRTNDGIGNPVSQPNFSNPADTEIPVNPQTEKEKGSAEKEKSEIPIKPPSANFVKFQQWILDNASQVSKFKEPFTEAEFKRIKADFDLPTIQITLERMHNWKPLLTKNISANLTFRKWAAMDKQEKTIRHGKSTTTPPNDAELAKAVSEGLARARTRQEWE